MPRLLPGPPRRRGAQHDARDLGVYLLGEYVAHAIGGTLGHGAFRETRIGPGQVQTLEARLAEPRAVAFATADEQVVVGFDAVAGPAVVADSGDDLDRSGAVGIEGTGARAEPDSADPN